MALTCSCPAATSLSAIPAVQCAENFGQIQKVAFQRLVNGTTKNGFDATNKITALASWTAAMALATSGKIVVSPYIKHLLRRLVLHAHSAAATTHWAV